MRNYLIIAIAIAVMGIGGITNACPSGQREECVVPTPWGCRQMICIPDVFVDPLTRSCPTLYEDQTGVKTECLSLDSQAISGVDTATGTNGF
jgi:hypothetical protein